jgi:hypothetical protein
MMLNDTKTTKKTRIKTKQIKTDNFHAKKIVGFWHMDMPLETLNCQTI